MIQTLKTYFFPLPRFSAKAFNIYRRQILVSIKLWKGALAFLILEPLITLVGMGMGIGSLLPELGGVSYLEFIAIGLIIFSPANIGVLEIMYGGFSRMEHQRTWEGIMDTSMSLDDIVFGEIIWATFRGLINGFSLWLTAWLLGAFSHPFYVLLALLISAVVAFTSASIGMILVARAKVFDVFTMFHTVVFIPATFLSGVFFPYSQLPQFLQTLAWCLPFAPLIEAARLFSQGQFISYPLFHGLILAVAYAIPAYFISTAMIRKRLMG